MKRPVGILGGMGPEATVDLMTRVIAAVDAGDDADHIPLIVHQNSQVPSRIAALIEGHGEDPAPVLAAMAQDLERAGAVALAMPCNTAHHYAPAIRAATDLPFLDMVELAGARAQELAPGGRIGVLGSPALATIGVYDRALSARGLTTLHVPDGDAALGLIRRIKADGASQDTARAIRALADTLIAREAGAICVACTEFSLMTDTLADQSVPVFDSLDLLVDAIVKASTSNDTADDLRRIEALSGSGRLPVEPTKPSRAGRMN